jgi:hypothetical protein
MAEINPGNPDNGPGSNQTGMRESKIPPQEAGMVASA